MVAEDTGRRRNWRPPHPFTIACSIIGVEDLAADWECSPQYVYRVRKAASEDPEYKFPADRIPSVVRLTHGMVTGAQLRPDLALAFKTEA